LDLVKKLAGMFLPDPSSSLALVMIQDELPMME